jgi:hypothetical protein
MSWRVVLPAVPRTSGVSGADREQGKAKAYQVRQVLKAIDKKEAK